MLSKPKIENMTAQLTSRYLISVSRATYSEGIENWILLAIDVYSEQLIIQTYDDEAKLLDKINKLKGHYNGAI